MKTRLAIILIVLVLALVLGWRVSARDTCTRPFTGPYADYIEH